jgi:hypothetical protein
VDNILVYQGGITVVRFSNTNKVQKETKDGCSLLLAIPEVRVNAAQARTMNTVLDSTSMLVRDSHSSGVHPEPL